MLSCSKWNKLDHHFGTRLFGRGLSLDRLVMKRESLRNQYSGVLEKENGGAVDLVDPNLCLLRVKSDELTVVYSGFPGDWFGR